MAISNKVRSNIVDSTRKIGTKASTYLEDFFDVVSSKGVTTFEEWRQNSNKYKEKDVSTLRQVNEVLTVFGLIDDQDKIPVKFKTKEEFLELINNNILEITLEEKFKKKTRNIDKILNSFLFITWIENHKPEEYKDISDPSLVERTKQMKIEGINYEKISERLEAKMSSFLDLSGYVKDSFKEEFNIEKQDLTKSNILKEEIKTKTKNAFEFISYLISGISDSKIIIPFYQREYVWDDELSENLIKDIASNNNKFLNIGNILIKQDGQNKIIVDGQQRLTTLILLFDNLLKLINKYSMGDQIKDGNIEFFNGFKKQNIERNLENLSNEKYMNDLSIVLNLGIDDEKKILEKDIKNSNVISNYLTIRRFLKEINKDQIINIFEKMHFIFVSETTDKITDEIELFISTNSSRRPLSNFDLIRSLLISKINQKSNDKDKVHELINVFTEKLKFNSKGNEKEKDQFFKIYLELFLSTQALPSKEKDIFKKFNKHIAADISNNKELIDILDDLIKHIDYHRIVKGIDKIDFEKMPIKDFLINLSGSSKVNSIYEIFLIYIVKKISETDKVKEEFNIIINEFRKILFAFEMFDIKWKLFKFAGDSLKSNVESIFKRVFDDIEAAIEDERFDEIYLIFKNAIISKDGYIEEKIFDKINDNLERFRESDGIKKDNQALKILHRTCFYLYNGSNIDIKSKDAFYRINDQSIEHIFPQTNTKWLEDDEKSAKELVEYTQNIGNKFILDLNFNISIGNKTFKEKVSSYKEWNECRELDKTLTFEFKDNDFVFTKKEKWTKDDVLLREEYIITKLLELWSKFYLL